MYIMISVIHGLSV